MYALRFDYNFPYAVTDRDARPLPRLSAYISLLADDSRPVSAWPIVDSSAECSVFDGTLALQSGWTNEGLANRAEDVRPIHGVAAPASPLPGYLHHLTCYLPLGSRFAVLEFRAFLTPPDTLATPVLGRHGFLQQVDFALVEAERRFYLRFRDPTTVHDSW